MRPDDLIGIEEIASMFDVTRGTVQLWNSRARGILPPAHTRVSNVPLWLRSDVEAWGRDTGRLDRSGRPLRRVNRFDVP